jgi:hypothetical protein
LTLLHSQCLAAVALGNHLYLMLAIVPNLGVRLGRLICKIYLPLTAKAKGVYEWFMFGIEELIRLSYSGSAYLHHFVATVLRSRDGWAYARIGP